MRSPGDSQLFLSCLSLISFSPRLSPDSRLSADFEAAVMVAAELPDQEWKSVFHWGYEEKVASLFPEAEAAGLPSSRPCV